VSDEKVGDGLRSEPGRANPLHRGSSLKRASPHHHPTPPPPQTLPRQAAGVYAVIAPQMGKQVVAFQAVMEMMGDVFPGAFSGYDLRVIESHQSSKRDTSGTAKVRAALLVCALGRRAGTEGGAFCRWRVPDPSSAAAAASPSRTAARFLNAPSRPLSTPTRAQAIVGSFKQLGVDFDVDRIEMVREREAQVEEMHVPEEHLLGHAYHTYRLSSPDGSVGFEFQHNVCGRCAGFLCGCGWVGVDWGPLAAGCGVTKRSAGVGLLAASCGAACRCRAPRQQAPPVRVHHASAPSAFCRLTPGSACPHDNNPQDHLRRGDSGRGAVLEPADQEPGGQEGIQHGGRAQSRRDAVSPTSPPCSRRRYVAS